MPLPQLENRALRYALFAAWLGIAGVALYAYLGQRGPIEAALQSAFSASALVGAIVYVVVGSVRVFMLLPATFLLVAGLPFFAPPVLLGITMVAVLVSATICYFFAGALRMDEVLERKHAQKIATVKGLLQRHQLPIIVGWSFLMFLPTDVLCYVCGTLRVSYLKLIAGLLIGEGTVYAVYIYTADYFLHG